MAKCVHRCIGKYVKDTGLEDALVETGIFSPKVIESFIVGKDYVRSVRGIQILSTAIQMAKWKAFWAIHGRTEFTQVTNNLLNLSEALKEKDKQKCQQILKRIYKVSWSNITNFLCYAKSDLNSASIGMELLHCRIC